MASSSAAPAILCSGEGLLVGVRVSPSAKRTGFLGAYGERVKVSLSAPPEDNRANEELLRVLALWVGLPKESVRLQSGHASRDKVVAFSGISETELRERLAGLVQQAGSSR